MDTAATSNQPAPGSPATPASNNQSQAKGKKAESTAATTQLFRPINFEGNSPTPATPEGLESCSSKSTLANGSENGSDSVLDSAYNSDNPQPQMTENSEPATENGQSACKVTATLQNKSLWKDFRKIGNEMIVTKPGRRLFPALLVSLNGLDPDVDYTISLKVATADNQRYRYINLRWCATGESEVIQNEEKQTFRHPSSPNSGHFWMKRPISFKSIKITHYAKSQHGNILLHTMHKYIMKIVIDPADGSRQMVIPLPDSIFIAVSAYQNVEITQLKIDKNPFAKGFRYKVKGSEGDTPTSSSNGNSNGSSNGTPGHAKSSNGSMVINSIASVLPPHPMTPMARESPMMAYWQQLQMQGLVPHYNPILTMASPTSLQSSSTSSKEPSPADHPSGFTHISTMTNGITPHYPVFYHHPFLPAPPPYIVPTTPVGEHNKPKEAVVKEEQN